MPRHRAVTRVHLGGSPPAEPGELIPETYLDVEGKRRQVDFERLVGLGAAEPVKGRGKGEEKTEPESEPDVEPETEPKAD